MALNVASIVAGMPAWLYPATVNIQKGPTGAYVAVSGLQGLSARLVPIKGGAEGGLFETYPEATHRIMLKGPYDVRPDSWAVIGSVRYKVLKSDTDGSNSETVLTVGQMG